MARGKLGRFLFAFLSTKVYEALSSPVVAECVLSRFWHILTVFPSQGEWGDWARRVPAGDTLLCLRVRRWPLE